MEKNEENNQKKIILENEIKNTKKIIKNIYEIREKKILNSIMTKIRGGEPNIKNLIENEKVIFDLILDILIKQRNKIIEDGILKNNISYKKKITNIKKKENNENYKIFLVKENLPVFIGTDTKKYNLRKNDIITIKKNTSELLLKKDVIKEIKIQ